MTQNGQAYYVMVMLRQCLAIVFSVAANTTSVNLSFASSLILAKFDSPTTDLKAQIKYFGAIS